MYFIVNIALVSLLLSTAVGHVILCYYGSWATNRPGNGLFNPEHMDPTICTHIIYAFIGVSANGSIIIFDPWIDLPENGGKDGFRKFVALKKISPSTKVMISIGGWNHASTTFSPMVTDPTTRATFVKNVVAFLKTYDFDGLDVNWEYPAQRGGISTDVENYVCLLQELKEAFETDGYILSASVGAAESIASLSYDIPKVSKYVDFIGLMTYDLNGSWNRAVGINAPLYPASYETTAAKLRLNVDACVNYWLNNGADRKKIVLGIPLYGRTFTLANRRKTKPGSTSVGPGKAGPYTQEAGFVGYNELCEKNLTEKWTTVWFEEQKVPYAYYGLQWVGYDNEQSISIKTNYAIERGLAGVMFWSAETDDFRAICHDTKFPLIKTAYNILVAPFETTSHPDTTNGDNEVTSPLTSTAVSEEVTTEVTTSTPSETTSHPDTTNGDNEVTSTSTSAAVSEEATSEVTTSTPSETTSHPDTTNGDNEVTSPLTSTAVSEEVTTEVTTSTPSETTSHPDTTNGDNEVTSTSTSAAVSEEATSEVTTSTPSETTSHPDTTNGDNEVTSPLTSTAVSEEVTTEVTTSTPSETTSHPDTTNGDNEVTSTSTSAAVSEEATSEVTTSTPSETTSHPDTTNGDNEVTSPLTSTAVSEEVTTEVTTSTPSETTSHPDTTNGDNEVTSTSTSAAVSEEATSEVTTSTPSETTSHPDTTNGDNEVTSPLTSTAVSEEVTTEVTTSTPSETTSHPDTTNGDNEVTSTSTSAAVSEEATSEVTTSTPSETTSHPDTTNGDNEVTPPSTSTAEKVTTVEPSTTTKGYIISNTVCTTNGYHRYEDDCSKFWQCVGLASGGYIGYLLECPPPLYFDITLKVCNWPNAVVC